MTRMQVRRLAALEARTAFAADPAAIVAAMDQITDLYPDPRTRPPAVAAVHDRLAAQLNHPKET